KAEANVTAAGKELAKAGHDALLLDGAAASCLTADPVAARRHLQLHDLLGWQASRAFLDHWFADDGQTPYYCRVGKDYTGDARRLVKADFTAVAKAEQDLRQTAVNASD